MTTDLFIKKQICGHPFYQCYPCSMIIQTGSYLANNESIEELPGIDKACPFSVISISFVYR